MISADVPYRVRGSVSLFAKKINLEEYEVAFLFVHSRIIHTYIVNDNSYECILNLDGIRTARDIAKLLGTKVANVIAILRLLLTDSILTKEAVDHGEERFSRQLNFLSSFETSSQSSFEMQQRIKTGVVAVIGIGSIGSWILESLARSGISSFILIDNDIVEPSNLQRQALFSEYDIGKSKVDAAAVRLRLIDKQISVKTFTTVISDPETLSALIKMASVVVNCADMPDIATTNECVSKACFAHRIPHVLCGGYDGHISFLGQTVLPGISACWRCYSESSVYEEGLDGYEYVQLTKQSLQGGTIAPIAAITANFHALEVLKVLSSYSRPTMLNQVGEFDFLKYEMSSKSFTRNPRCSLCANV
jgi:molybdopterin-synthase adenylyltransferase